MKKFELFCQRYGIALIPVCLILAGCGLWPEMEMLVPSLPGMKRAFGIHDSHIQQLLTVNFVGFLLGVLVAGPLCDSVGRRKVFTGGAVVYLFSSLLSALAWNFPVLMAFRFLQGLSMTGPVIAGSVLLLESTYGAKQIFWMSLANSSITFCMAVAPIVGTWVNDLFGYQGNLWSILILGIVGISPTLFFVPESLEEEKKRPIQLALLVKGYISLLKDWRFMCLMLPITALAAAYWIYVGISALYMVDYLGLPAAHFGRYQGPIVGCFSVISLASGRLLVRFGLLKCVKFGISLMSVGCTLLLGMSVLGLDHAICTTIFMMIFVGGMAPICSVLFPQSVAHLPPELQGNAQALLNAMRLLFASLGTFLLGFIYKGPLLPVSIMLFVIFVISTWLLWKGRVFMKEVNTQVPLMGGH